MSDFVNEFWNFYVMAITAGGILFCAWLIWSQNKHQPVPNSAGDVGTSGHVWDGDIEEFNHPLPRWWLWLFIITIVFSIVYLAMYPGFGRYKGALGWTQVGQYDIEVQRADEKIKPIFDRFAKMDLKAVAADKEGQEIGRRLFLTYCSQCHGSDAKGSSGFPNLTDKDWQWGGDYEQIKTSILDGRVSAMPPFAHLGAGPIAEVADYVRSLSGEPTDPVLVAKGKDVFNAAGCAGCHGPDAKGNPALGAPNLTDKIWLYGRSKEKVIETISKGRQNKMPPWKDFLGPDKVHLLAGYVASLGGVQATVAAGSSAVVKVYFDLGAAQPPADIAALLQPLLDQARAAPAGKIAISGFHDKSGDPAKNAELAKQRALAIRDALKAAGLAEDRIELRKPQETTGGAEDKEARRVELSLI